MVGYSEKAWLKWKMRRGKWPDLGLNSFPLHFSFINNPPTTQSTPNHTLLTPPPPLLLPRPSLTPSQFALCIRCSSRNLLERETNKEHLPVVLFSCGSKERVGKVEKEMGGWCMEGRCLWWVVFIESLFLQVLSVVTLEWSLDLKKAMLLALLNLQSQEARYRS